MEGWEIVHLFNNGRDSNGNETILGVRDTQVSSDITLISQSNLIIIINWIIRFVFPLFVLFSYIFTETSRGLVSSHTTSSQTQIIIIITP